MTHHDRPTEDAPSAEQLAMFEAIPDTLSRLVEGEELTLEVGSPSRYEALLAAIELLKIPLGSGSVPLEKITHIRIEDGDSALDDLITVATYTAKQLLDWCEEETVES